MSKAQKDEPAGSNQKKEQLSFQEKPLLNNGTTAILLSQGGII